MPFAASCVLSLVALLSLVPAFSAARADDWKTLTVPDAWRSVPGGELAPIDGYSWYRAMVRVPAEWDGEELTLFLEALDDARSAWVGGRPVGATGTFPPQFRSGLGERGRYSVDPSLVKGGGFLTVAIRVYQSDPRPNFSVAPPVLMNAARKQAMRLEGVWQYRPGDDSNWANATAADFGFDATQPLNDADAVARGVYLKTDEVDDPEKYVVRRSGDTEPLNPAEAVRHFQTPEDLSVQLVLGDPDIAQPLFMSWDERGRLWVMEYRQYPEIAGLKMLSRDTFLRSVYDKVPPAPPNHDKGADRISIHEDTDGDGVYDNHKIFVDELNLATSFAIGRGGVFVTNPPYLLFYPDRNADDIPDGDPEVLLEGFGIEDSHSVINSLRFGPDGWLYGAQGSTVTGVVKKPGSKEPPVRSLGQLIWRYHPERGIYEIFAEGGGNTFGCEIDAKGRIYSGHNGGDTRGFHYVQGGSYRKGFGKHGPLSNPYAFGFFENIKHHTVARFTHNFIIYEENTLPQRFRGQLFGIEPLQGQVVLSNFKPYQSSFETEDIERVLKTDDPWFRPVDIKAGPDGDIYIADMYEQRIDHSSHYAGRVDKTSGRIYKLTNNGERSGVGPPVHHNLRLASTAELIKLLDDPSKQHRQTVIRILGDRKDKSVIQQLASELAAATGQSALDRLWALNACGGFTDEMALKLLSHNEPFVRAWTVRLVCDQTTVSADVAAAIALAATTEAYIDVRKQMASSARRLPSELALPIIRELLRFDEDAADIHQPLLIWWAIESQAGRTTIDDIIQKLLADSATWERPLVADVILERLMKRYALAGTRNDFLSAAMLLNAAPDKQSISRLLKGFEEAFQGRSLAGIPDELVQALAKSGGGSLALRFRQGQPDAVSEAVKIIQDAQAEPDVRRQLIEICGQVQTDKLRSVLLEIVRHEQDPTILACTFTALQNYDTVSIADEVIARFSGIPQDARLAAEALLVSRTAWSKELLAAIDAGTIGKEQITSSGLRKMLLHGDDAINAAVNMHWSDIGGLSPAQVQAEISHVQTVLAAGSGNPRTGKKLFMQNCGRCHLLFDEGGRIGPDLTPFARDNLDRMLSSIVNPSLEIREGFENYVVLTNDGRALNGFLADKDSQIVILRGVDGQNIVLKKDDIEEMHVVPQSVMPEGALKPFDEQQIRDLFAYLRATQPVNY
ncbi:MAG: c-type cytochrome [Planctomycetaceae bacterium]